LPAEHFRPYVTDRFKEMEKALPLAADLYLACACLHDVGGAHEAFDQKYRPVSDRACLGIDDSHEFADEVWQRLTVSLFVARQGEEPKIRLYLGKAPLAHWLIVTAKREALKVKTRGPEIREVDSKHLENVFIDAGSPAFLALEEKARAEAKIAFREAVAALPDPLREMLLLSAVHGWSGRQIGEKYGVHQTTVSRNLATVRALILDHVRARLRENLDLSDTACNSLINAVKSQLDLSFPELPEEDGDPPPD
jgi:RNA polymerase sigma-70 factor (ECF subfamily)